MGLLILPIVADRLGANSKSQARSRYNGEVLRATGLTDHLDGQAAPNV
jgi:hypothetical protein